MINNKNMALIEIKIDDEFYYNNKKVKCVERNKLKDCVDCIFYIDDMCENFECLEACRIDQKNVVFKIVQDN